MFITRPRSVGATVMRAALFQESRSIRGYVTAIADSAARAANYFAGFNNFVRMMIYFLVPWAAVNLGDFHFVRHIVVVSGCRYLDVLSARFSAGGVV